MFCCIILSLLQQSSCDTKVYPVTQSGKSSPISPTLVWLLSLGPDLNPIQNMRVDSQTNICG